jgi:Na+/proline symporter
MLSAKNEKHAVGATLLFNGMHYALRPWPWILVALASLIVFPDLASLSERFPQIPEQVVRHDLAYPAMLTFLPAGLLGLVVTSLAAAYMSTMSTQVNWGSSIIVNDVYRRFINPGASEKQLVWVGRLCTVLLMVVACTLALFLENALQVFEIVLQIGAGTGLLFLLRWFWWRINAATEITAMVVSFVVALYFQFMGGEGLEAWEKLVLGVAITTVAWLVVAYLTRPTDEAVLRAFYRKIKPGGPGWRPVAARIQQEGDHEDDTAGSDLPYGLTAAVFGATGIYSILFATGFFLYGRLALGVVFSMVALVALSSIVAIWKKLSFE